MGKQEILKESLDKHGVEHGEGYIDDDKKAYDAIYEAMDNYKKEGKITKEFLTLAEVVKGLQARLEIIEKERDADLKRHTEMWDEFEKKWDKTK